MAYSSSIIGVSSLYQSNPSLDHYSRQYISVLPLYRHFRAFSSSAAAAHFRGPKSSSSKTNLNSFVPLAVLTPNSSVLSEEAFKGLGGFGKNILDASESVYEDSEGELGQSEAGVDKDELDIARLGLPQQLVESLQKRGITQLFPIQVPPLPPVLSFLRVFCLL